MQTLCPHCHTLFRIRADQLAAKAGWVRCGVCMTAFQSLTQLDDTAAAPTQAAAPEPAAPPLQIIADEEPAPALFIEPPTENQIDPDPDPDPEPTPAEPMVIQFVDEQNPAPALPSRRAATPAPRRSGLTLGQSLTPAWAWRLSALLTLILLAQGLWGRRHAPSAPTAQALTLAQVRFNPVADWPDLLQLSFTLNNPSPEAQALPSLTLMFANGHTQTLAADQYSSPSTPTLTPAQSRTETLWLKRSPDNPLTTTPSAWMPNQLALGQH